MLSKIPIFCHTQKSFSQKMASLLGRGKRQAGLIYSEWFRRGNIDLENWKEKQSLPLAKEILEAADFFLPELSLQKTESKTVKFLLKFPDKLESESVVIPMEAGVTLCISSQVGCRMGCAFCETGKMGLLRHLSVEEIVAQVFIARFRLNCNIRNIVFMGMGEPLDNFDAVMQAIDVLTDCHGLNFGQSRITVSTSGDVEAIYRFIERADPALNLAVSVNAPNDAIRDRIMPVNKKWNMQQLKKSMGDYCSHPRRKILVEYVLLKGINDSLECAEELALYLEGLKVKVNLIPYNPQSRDVFSPPEEKEIDAFMAKMRERGYQTLLRHSKGQKIMAACGQLGNKEMRKVLAANKFKI